MGEGGRGGQEGDWEASWAADTDLILDISGDLEMLDLGLETCSDTSEVDLLTL